LLTVVNNSSSFILSTFWRDNKGSTLYLPAIPSFKEIAVLFNGGIQLGDVEDDFETIVQQTRPFMQRWSRTINHSEFSIDL
jgi:hypothetical protein